MADTLFLSSSWQSDLLLPLRDTFHLPGFDSPVHHQEDTIGLSVDGSACWKDPDDSNLLTSDYGVDDSERCSQLSLDQEVDDDDNLLGLNNSSNYSPTASVSTPPSLSSVFTGDVDTDTLEEVMADNDLDWCYQLDNDIECESDQPVSCTVSVEETPSPKHRSPSKRRSPVKFHCSRKAWEDMELSERISLTEDLTQIVSSQMGLREQLDVIRLINPAASVNPTDKEFVIDLNCLNDTKLQLVRDYINRHRASSRSHDNDVGAGGACRHLSHKTRKGRGHQRRCASDTDASCVTSLQQVSKTSKSHRRRAAQENRQRRQKEYRQSLKERRSGLFRREEVLALCVAKDDESDDADDVDIVT